MINQNISVSLNKQDKELTNICYVKKASAKFFDNLANNSTIETQILVDI